MLFELVLQDGWFSKHTLSCSMDEKPSEHIWGVTGVAYLIWKYLCYFIVKAGLYLQESQGFLALTMSLEDPVQIHSLKSSLFKGQK